MEDIFQNHILSGVNNMKSIAIILLVLLISCDNVNDVSIINNNSVISPGDTLEMKLYAPYNEHNMPAFYILIDRDTFALPFDTKKKCSIYNAFHLLEKKHRYTGYVLYTTPDNKKKKSTFEISYEVRK